MDLSELLTQLVEMGMNNPSSSSFGPFRAAPTSQPARSCPLGFSNPSGSSFGTPPTSQSRRSCPLGFSNRSPVQTSENFPGLQSFLGCPERTPQMYSFTFENGVSKMHTAPKSFTPSKSSPPAKSVDAFEACLKDKLANCGNEVFTCEIQGVQCVIMETMRFNWCACVMFPKGHPDCGRDAAYLKKCYSTYKPNLLASDDMIGFTTIDSDEYCLAREMCTDQLERNLPYRSLAFVKKQAEHLAIQVAKRNRRVVNPQTPLSQLSRKDILAYLEQMSATPDVTLDGSDRFLSQRAQAPTRHKPTATPTSSTTTSHDVPEIFKCIPDAKFIPTEEYGEYEKHITEYLKSLGHGECKLFMGTIPLHVQDFDFENCSDCGRPLDSSESSSESSGSSESSASAAPQSPKSPTSVSDRVNNEVANQLTELQNRLSALMEKRQDDIQRVRGATSEQLNYNQAKIESDDEDSDSIPSLESDTESTAESTSETRTTSESTNSESNESNESNESDSNSGLKSRMNEMLDTLSPFELVTLERLHPGSIERLLTLEDGDTFCVCKQSEESGESN